MNTEDDAITEAIAAATEAHHIDLGRRDADGNNPCVCGEWWECAMGPGWDEHMADVALAALAEIAWILPKVEHDESRAVTPIVRGGWIHREQGLSDPEHTRFYAAQLLAAADQAAASHPSTDTEEET